jgi:hypothetical protein
LDFNKRVLRNVVIFSNPFWIDFEIALSSSYSGYYSIIFSTQFNVEPSFINLRIASKCWDFFDFYNSIFILSDILFAFYVLYFPMLYFVYNVVVFFNESNSDRPISVYSMPLCNANIPCFAYLFYFFTLKTSNSL